MSSPTDKSTQPSKAKRSRAGCLSCRRRHKKCDEAKPICKNCELRNAFCEWPIKGIFKNKNLSSRKKSATSSGNNFCNQPGTNYHQIINGELAKLLQNNPETQDTNDSIAVPPINYPTNNDYSDVSLPQNMLSASSMDLLGLVNNSFAVTPLESDQLTQRSDSISSTSPSLFSNPNNSTYNASSPDSEIDYNNINSQLFDTNKNNINNAVAANSGISKKVEHYQLKEDLLLKSFQFTSSSQFLRVPDAEKYQASHKLLRNFMLANVFFNKQKCTSASIKPEQEDLLIGTPTSPMVPPYEMRSNATHGQLLHITDSQRHKCYQSLSAQLSQIKGSSYGHDLDTFDAFNEFINKKEFNFGSFSSTNQTILSIEEKNKLVQNFINKVLPVLQISSTSASSLSKALLLAFNGSASKSVDNDHLTLSILALSARVTELTEKLAHNDMSQVANEATTNSKCLDIYNKALKVLVDTMQPTEAPSNSQLSETSIAKDENNDKEERETLATLCSCLLLFFLEVLTSCPKDYKNHLESLLIFVKSYNMHGFNINDDPASSTKKILSELFWLIIKVDLHFSITFNEPTLISSNSYLPPNFEISNISNVREYFWDNSTTDLFFSNETSLNAQRTETYGNYLCYLTARSLELIHNNSNLNNDIYIKEWEQLSSELETWKKHRKPDLLPIINNSSAKIEINPDTYELNFPLILYGNSTATYLNQLYCATEILLFENQRRSDASMLMNQVNCGFDSLMEETKLNNLIYNAVKIIAISLNDTNCSSLTFSLPFNYVASNLLTKNSNRKANGALFYYDSKVLMKKLLKNEQSNAFPLKWKFSDF